MAVLPFLVAAWLAGLGVAAELGQPAWAWLGVGTLALVALVLWWPKRRGRWLLAGLVALSLGAARYAGAQPPWGAADFIATYNDSGAVTLEGVVADEVVATDAGVTLRLRAERLWLGDARESLPVSGWVQVAAPRYAADRLAQTGAAEYAYGDRLRLTGPLQTPPIFDSFSYRGYLAGRGVHALLTPTTIRFVAADAGSPGWAALYAFKTRALATLAQIFPEPHAALLAGILLGQERGIPAELQTAFQRTGTSHIVAISGFNIAILAALMAAALRRLAGPQRGLWMTLGALALYTLLVGASGSVVRAAIMGGLALVARRLGRSAAGLGGLALAAWLMTLHNPLTLWDVGFQLSAAATLGLVLYADRLEAAFTQLAARWAAPARAQQAAALAAELLLLTLAAQLTTLPLLIYHFRQLSVISLAANLLILPVQPAVMVGGGAALALGLLWPPLGQVAAWLVWPSVAYTIRVVTALADVPGAALALGDTAPALLALTYLALFGGTALLARPAAQQPAWWTALAPQRKAAGGLALLGVTTLAAWSWFFSLPPVDGRLRVTLLDLAAPAEAPGGGEALLVQTPSGRTVLIGGGPGGLTLARALDGTLPLFTRALDVLVIAAPGNDHLGALPEALERYTVARAVLTRAPGVGTAYRVLVDELNQGDTLVLDAGTLPVLDLGDGVMLRVLADTEHGSLLRLEAGRFSLLAAPGLTAAEAADFVAQGLAQPATALLLAHNGADAANSAAWVQAINPQVVLIAAQPASGPDPILLGRLAGRAVLRTDLHGAVTVMTDGTQLWVETER